MQAGSLNALERILDLDLFNKMDIHFARFMHRLAGGQNSALMLAALLLSYRTGQGDICLDIDSVGGRPLDSLLPEASLETETAYLPGFEEWIAQLRSSSIVGQPGEYTPLVLDAKGRLYLFRYWEYEQLLATSIKARLGRADPDFDEQLLKQGIDRLFPRRPLPPAPDWQRVAACVGVTSRFCVVSGGPGTGKTWTVVRILALLVEQARVADATLRIALAAPTGKAAARLKESAKQLRASLPLDVKDYIPEEAQTIHRLLGTRPDSVHFRHNAQNPLPYDVVIVDESSMADCALMSKLLQALSLQARLILVGDKDQLASVEAGGVFGDICSAVSQGYSASLVSRAREVAGEAIADSQPVVDRVSIADSIVILKQSHRFGGNSGIGALSRTIRAGDTAATLRILARAEHSDVAYVDTSAKAMPLAERVLAGYGPFLAAESAEGALQLLPRFVVLCAVRQGEFGVQHTNLLVESMLARSGRFAGEQRWYRGRPVMILRNDYARNLFNGDVGVIHGGEGRLRFYCTASEGSLRSVLPLQLPEHETAYAMTVHKSQGSEFDSLLLLLPDRFSPVLTRELLYTAVTRARDRVEIWGSEAILRSTVENSVQRQSGLSDALRPPE